MKRRGQIAIFVIIALLIVGGIVALFAMPKKNITLGSCTSDSDCVPASCCHPSSCIAKEQAPQCKGIMCSQVCEPGTLDCMQGSCICENNQCKTTIEQAGIANPASVYCEENNGTLEIRTDAKGGQYGICILTNGTECDEWKYFRGGC